MSFLFGFFHSYYNIILRKSILTNRKHYDIINAYTLEMGGVVINLRIWWAERQFKMSGTKAGGMKAAATNKAKYGKEFYARIGKKGGQNGHTGGFAANPALARVAGAKGGRISRRGPAKKAA